MKILESFAIPGIPSEVFKNLKTPNSPYFYKPSLQKLEEIILFKAERLKGIDPLLNNPKKLKALEIWQRPRNSRPTIVKQPLPAKQQVEVQTPNLEITTEQANWLTKKLVKFFELPVAVSRSPLEANLWSFFLLLSLFSL